MFVSASAFSAGGLRCRPIRQQLEMKEGRSPLNEWAKKVLPLALSTAFFVAPPTLPADAASSGGRTGGSSFRSSGRSMGGGYRSSTRLGGGYGGGYSSGYARSPMSIAPMPFYSPFSPFGFSPFGFMPINFNLLVVGFIAYAALNVLSNRTGGSDFDNSGDNGALGAGASIIKIQVALDADWAQPGNIMEQLTAMSQRNSIMSGRSSLAKLLSDASIAVLRRQSQWNSAAYDSEFYGGFMSAGKMQDAEPAFQRLAVAERAKFEEETTGSGYVGIKPADSVETSSPTKCVVSILAAVRGRSEAMLNRVDSVSDCRSVLQNLASDALTDDGENIMGVEILWTPSIPGVHISEQELVNDYPELMRL